MLPLAPEQDSAWLPSPDHSKIVVAENGQGIVCFWVAKDVAHVEPVWIKPEMRNSTTLIHIWMAMRQLLADCGITTFYAFSDNEQISSYLQRLGFKDKNWKVFEGRL